MTFKRDSELGQRLMDLLTDEDIGNILKREYYSARKGRMKEMLAEGCSRGDVALFYGVSLAVVQRNTVKHRPPYLIDPHTGDMYDDCRRAEVTESGASQPGGYPRKTVSL